MELLARQINDIPTCYIYIFAPELFINLVRVKQQLVDFLKRAQAGDGCTGVFYI
ncbi:hypothetical protein DSM106972_030700 [Dulcicalothrix desertica PCC 7102]|uniref:Uncharacterized protein n=1 Tax=Dulcicalothrix desertica PCC 7102 TaxID=232991 RepID=A0A433VKZ6_9CYAN|nr:hypothetical protein DSM106972_030700 [Dulcicalothrix desertica PCC 7102]TWH50078.1 hypothetical protein CAL7102_04360 [Dulcicalothrix desertica PCC 7102]